MSDNPTQFIISIMSRDRVGIVYEISTAISELGGDIADLSQTVLRDYFTMILVATFPKSVAEAAIKAKLSNVDSQSATTLEVTVKPLKPKLQSASSSNTSSTDITQSYVLTASGQDRIGFVAQVSGFCAKNNINILDLLTTVAEDTYIMILLVDLSQSVHIDIVRRKLTAFAKENNLTTALQHYDIFKATNEISRL